MSKLCFFVFPFCVALYGPTNLVFSQESSADLPDSPSYVLRSAAHEDSLLSDREVSWRKLPRDFLHDQKEIWLFPTSLTSKRTLLPTLAAVGGTAGLIYADPHVMPFFRSHEVRFDDLNDVFDPSITSAEIIALPVLLLTAGYVRHDSYLVGTAILCAEAYGDSAVVEIPLKAITRRERPRDITTGSFSSTFFNGNKSPFRGSGFPSGHAAAAFSVATVVARRYRNYRWVPWAVYGLATAISFSRVTSNAHFPSDVFLGAALGYTITRYQVIRRR
jgi:membrane-associated phospholipid phosphatase